MGGERSRSAAAGSTAAMAALPEAFTDDLRFAVVDVLAEGCNFA